MAGNSFTQWQQGEALPIGPTPVFRDAKDMRLAAFGATPDTQHPDGYLGTQGATTRRQDKLLDGVHRQNHRSYSRGVHKGERINPGDYVWPDEFGPWTGLQTQAMAEPWKHGYITPKFAPRGAEPVTLTNDGKVGPRGIPRGLVRPDQEIIDAERRSRLKTLAPGWR